MLCFRFDLIQHSMCECGHGLDAFGTHLVCCAFGSQQITIDDTIQDIMYSLARKSGHIVLKEWWYALTSRVSLQIDLYMTREDQVFVVDVVVTNPT
jgi:hypothetical protein